MAPFYGAFCGHDAYESERDRALRALGNGNATELVFNVMKPLLSVAECRQARFLTQNCVLLTTIIIATTYFYNKFFPTPQPRGPPPAQVPDAAPADLVDVECSVVQNEILSIKETPCFSIVKQNNHSIRPKKTYEHTLCTYPGGSIRLLEIKQPNPFYALPHDVDDLIDKFLGGNFHSIRNRFITSKESAKLLSVIRIRQVTSELREMKDVLGQMNYSTPDACVEAYVRKFLDNLKFLVLTMTRNPHGDYRGKRWDREVLRAVESAKDACDVYYNKLYFRGCLRHLMNEYRDFSTCVNHLKKIQKILRL